MDVKILLLKNLCLLILKTPHVLSVSQIWVPPDTSLSETGGSSFVIRNISVSDFSWWLPLLKGFHKNCSCASFVLQGWERDLGTDSEIGD